VLERAARGGPLVLVYEDLHWADPTSLVLLEHLLSLTDRVPLLLVCVFRPLTDHGCWRIRETAARDYRHRHADLWLDPLSECESTELVDHLLCSEELPAALRAPILEHADGNPFYVEEILRSLIDRGILVYDEATGRWGAAQEVPDIPVPDTLRGVLMARIDRLPGPARQVLQAASVIGRIFSYPILVAVCSPLPTGDGAGGEGQGSLDDDLLTHLIALERAQLIRERVRLPEAEYIFKHQLTLEAAYDSLLMRKRRDLHRRVAQALEQLHPGRIEEQLGLLAHHWERAGDAERAISYLLRAGEQAAARFANAEAVSYFSRALELLPEDRVQDRFALLLAREAALDLQGARDAQRRDLAALEALAQRLADPALQADVALRQAHYATRTQRYGAAANAARIALRSAEAAGDVARQAAAHRELGRVLRYTWHEEQLALAQAELEQALDLARAVGAYQIEVDALHNLGDIRAVRGDLDDQRHCFEEQLRICRKTGNYQDEGRALRDLGMCFLMRCRYAEAIHCFEQSLHVCRQTGNRRDEGWALLFLGDVRVLLGDYATAISYSAQALRVCREAGDRLGELQTCACLIQAATYTGDYAEAKHWIAHVEQVGAYSYRWAVLAGDLAWAQREVELAQAEYEKALESKVTEDVVSYYKARCGLAQIALAEENLADAQRWSGEIRPVLGRSWGGSPYVGLRPHLICFQVLQASGDPHAREVLEEGYRLLQERAAQIDDPDLRRSYLENVAVHREIATAYERRSALSC
jgi:tetratricopeptide (TPR) repeat protein